MGNREQYLKYKPIFRQITTLEVAFSITSLLTLVLLFFMPCFRIGTSAAEISGFEINFTLYDEVACFVPQISKLNSPSTVMSMFWAFQIFALICFAGGLVGAVVFFIQAVLTFCFRPETYAIAEYNFIKLKTLKQKNFRQNRPLDFTVAFRNTLHVGVFLGLISEVIAIIFAVNVNITDLASGYFDYFVMMNGVAWGFWIVLVLILVDIAFMIINAVLRSQVKAQIQKEDDENTAPPADNNPFAPV